MEIILEIDFIVQLSEGKETLAVRTGANKLNEHDKSIYHCRGKAE